MTNSVDVQTRREEFEQGYRDGFRSVQGNVLPPKTPRIVLETGSKPYDQGHAYGVRDAGGKR
ncbi:hypothetical protein OM280_23155 [Escherichia albertii]|nr:hypothetical protein [Escherichia albertii]